MKSLPTIAPLGLAAFVSLVGCGRTGLGAPSAVPSVETDGGRCGNVHPSPGAVVWHADLPAGLTFVGPLAADTSGTTYFIGTTSPRPATYTLVALDACGTLLWQVDGIATDYIDAADLTVFVNRDQLVVQWGAVDSFDRGTGARRWSASLDAYAIHAGLGNLTSDDSASIGPSACASDGTVFIPFATSAAGEQILAILPDGMLFPVASLPRVNQGSPISLVVDGAGQVDILSNTSLAGALVRSFTQGGLPVFSASFPCRAGFLGALASGSDFLFMQTAPCALTLDGRSAFSLSAGFDSLSAVAIDAANDLYVGGSMAGVRSFDRTGLLRWATAPSRYLVGGPLLAEGHQVLVASSDLASTGAGAVTLSALDTDTGRLVWERSYAAGLDGLGGFNVLLTGAEQVVFSWQNHVTAVASGQPPSADAPWPTPGGGPDQRRAALGR